MQRLFGDDVEKDYRESVGEEAARRKRNVRAAHFLGRTAIVVLIAVAIVSVAALVLACIGFSRMYAGH